MNSPGGLPDGVFARVTHETVPPDGDGERGVGVRVVTAIGEIDMAAEPILTEGLNEMFMPGTAPVVIDLSQVTFFGSPGIAALSMARAKAEAAGTAIVLVVRPASATARTLQILGIDTTSEYLCYTGRRARAHDGLGPHAVHGHLGRQ